MKRYVILAAWTVLAGAGIPLIGILNGAMARSIGNPFAATVAMFAVAMGAALSMTLPLYGYPSAAQLGSSPVSSWAAGLLISFYALSATVIIPRFGAASFVAYILIAQLLTSAIVDHFGLFAMERRPLDLTKLVGLAAIAGGITIMEIGNLLNTSNR